MKIPLIYIMLPLILLTGCISLETQDRYSVTVLNRTLNKIEAVELTWGKNDKLLLGNLYPGSGASEAFVGRPDGPTIISWLKNDQRINKSLEIFYSIPRGSVGEITIKVMSDEQIEIGFSSEK